MVEEYQTTRSNPEYEILAVPPHTIRLTKGKRILHEELNPWSGYLEVKVDNTIRNKHQLIAEQFLTKPNEKTTIARHINGDKTDNRIENLEFVTHGDAIKRSRSENQKQILYYDRLPEGAVEVRKVYLYEFNNLFVTPENEYYKKSGGMYRKCNVNVQKHDGRQFINIIDVQGVPRRIAVKPTIIKPFQEFEEK